MNRLAVARIAAYAAVVVAGTWGIWSVERQADRLDAEQTARLEASCAAGNETRMILRSLSRDSALEVGEAIIEVASRDNADEPPDPEVIRQFREVMSRRLTAIVNQLPGRRWDERSQSCVDVELDQGG